MATKPAKAAKLEKSTPTAANDSTLASDLTDRLSQELVIGFVGPVASGVTTAANHVKSVLESDFGYDVAPIFRVSDIIRTQASLVEKTLPQSSKTASYFTDMQNTGNALRKTFGGNYLVEKVIEKIKAYRKEKKGYSGDNEVPGRRAYIIDSIKNLDELKLLQRVYRETFCLIGVFAPDDLRDERLSDLGYEEAERKKVMDRDQGEIATFGQDTRKIFVKSDFFICNDQIEDELKHSIERFINIIFDTEIHTPTRAESAMYEADAGAASSACMSRQVGASIVSKDGELIAVGWNDVPKYQGGLYGEDDRKVFDDNSKSIIDNDKRCYNWKGGICHNETRKTALIEDIASAAVKAASLDATNIGDIQTAVAKTDVSSIIEYSRSIHAEMEAILSVAREGKHSLVGATLYTNTYPCHNCARHIVASGIKEVFYIEPYLKSLAMTLHSDVISELPTEQGKVIFRQFAGVAPKNYFRLFRPKGDRKKDGKLIRIPKKEALPIFRIPLDSKMSWEDKVVADVVSKETEVTEKKGE